MANITQINGKKVKDVNAARMSSLAPVESSATASAAHEVGDYFWLNGTLYEATAAIAIGNAISEGTNCKITNMGENFADLKSELDNSVNILTASWVQGKSYNTPSSVTSISPETMVDTPTFCCIHLSVNPGDTITITGTGGSGSKLWVWTQSDGTIISRAASNAVLTDAELVAPENAAYFLSSVNKSLPHVVYVGTSVDSRLNAASSLLSFKSIGLYAPYTIESGKVDLTSALRAIPGKSMTTSTFNTTTIFDFETKATDSTIGTLYEPLRVRDDAGNAITPIYVSLDPAKYKQAVVVFGYAKDGTHDRSYTAADVSNGVLTLDSTTCYIVILKYSNLDLIIGTMAPATITDYYVGAGMQFETLHDCLQALQGDNSKKAVHMMGGQYDILSELGGAEFLASLTGEENWYDVCDMIPANTHIIGHGNVVITMTIPDGTPTAVATLLSPINMAETATVENVTINGNGCRYCVHAEGSRLTKNDNAVWRLINCKINKSNSISGVDNAIGSGVNDGDYFEIRDCVITNTGNAGLLVHDQQNVADSFYKSPRVLVSGCAFDVAYYPIVMSSTHSGAVSGAVIEMTVINCYCANKYMRKIGSGNVDVFHATYINTPHRTQNGTGIIDVIPDTEYNNFALT